MATTNKQKAALIGIALALLLLGGTAGAAIADPAEDKDKPNPHPCPDGYHWSYLYNACVRNQCAPNMRGPSGECRPDVVDPKGEVVDPVTNECPPGTIKNAARLKALAKFTGAQLEAELAKYPECVPIKCPEGTVRDAFGRCIHQCPQGMQWSPDQNKCMPSPVNCEPGSQWSSTLLRCVKNPVVDPKPDPGTDPKDIPGIIKNFPEGDNFYKTRFGDTLLGTTIANDHVSIAYAYLRREAFLAARELGGLDDAAAQAWAASIAKPVKAYTTAANILLCAGTNDACYGTYGYCGNRAKQLGRCKLPNGTFIQNHPGPHGRAIQLEPKHPDNLARLLAGQNLARSVTLGDSNKAGDGSSQRVNGSFNSLPAFWCPILDRKLLWDSKGKTIEPSSATWSDGTSRGWPPPIVMDRFLQDYANTGRTAWGCMKIGLEGE